MQVLAAALHKPSGISSYWSTIAMPPRDTWESVQVSHLPRPVQRLLAHPHVRPAAEQPWAAVLPGALSC